MIIADAWAQANGQGGGGLSLVPLILIFGVMYFLLIRPQMQRQKRHRAMIANLKKGDKIIAGGGIHATVSRVIDENTLEATIAEGIKIKLVSSMVADVPVTPGAGGAGNDNSKPSPGKKASPSKGKK